MADSVLTYNNLVGDGQSKTFRLTVASGNNVAVGTVLGYNTVTNKIEPYDSTGSNGVEKFYGIAAGDVDASASDSSIVVYVGGEYLTGGLIFVNSSDTATQAFINSARALGCYLKISQ